MCMQAARPSTRMAYHNEMWITVLHIFTLGVQFLVPVCCVYTNKELPIVQGFILVMLASIVFLKLISYAHCNHALRCVYFLILFSENHPWFLHHFNRLSLKKGPTKMSLM